MNGVRLLRAGVVIVLCAGCAQASEPPQMCTLIGCQNGVTVLLGSAYVAPVTVEIGPVGGVAQARTCSDTVECTAGVFFADLSAPELRVRVFSGNDTIVRTVRPEYRVSQPNGPDCPPTCRQAQVDLRTGAALP